MAYFNWNDSKILNIFLFFLPTRGISPPPVVLSVGVRTPRTPLGGNPAVINPSKPEFTMVIFTHYKPWNAVAILDL